MAENQVIADDDAFGKTRSDRSYPPDKGGKGGFLPYNAQLTAMAGENRKNPTPAEKLLWFEILQGRRLAGLKFTRQKPLAGYIVDFYCAELRLAIEIDGESHAAQADYDIKRTARLHRFGVEVIRYTNREVLANLDGVYADLTQWIEVRRRLPPTQPNPNRNPNPLNPPCQGDFDRDR